jgi:PBSX family phage terminase large subunit
MQGLNRSTGQRILFRGIDNPHKHKSIKIPFGYIKVFWAEEADQYAGPAQLRSITQSIFRGEGGPRLSILTYNPPKSARAWVNKESTVPKPSRVVHTSSYLNVPPKWLGPEFLAGAKALEESNPQAYMHEYLGEEVGTGLEIFNNVKIEPIPDSLIASFDKIRQGLDFGFAVDPLAFEKCHYDAKNRRLYVFKEISGLGISNRQLADRLSAEEKHERTIADSAEPKSIHELKVDYGLNIVGVKKGPGSVEHGVKWLSDLNAIIIDNVRCPLAAKEFVNYALEQRRDGEIVSRYPDKENHAIDSVRYALADDIGSRGDQKASVISARSLGL